MQEINNLSILRTLGVTQGDLIGSGTEAIAYALGDDRVLKVYDSLTLGPMVDILADFYKDMDAAEVPFEVPLILDQGIDSGFLWTIERKLNGKPLTEVLTDYRDRDFQRIYVDAVHGLARLKLKRPLDRYLLFDPYKVSSKKERRWGDFLCLLLQRKLSVVSPLLRAYVRDFDDRVAALRERLLRENDAFLAVVHGDVHPGNLLASPEKHITAVLDFGTFTMFGDPLLDLAAGWGFYGMYEADHSEIRNDLVEYISSLISEEALLLLQCYLLFYAIYTCDLYPDPDVGLDQTGHFQWAISVMGEDKYWEACR